MKTIPVDKLTTNFINLLEEIATTGDPIELDWEGKRFQILPIQKKSKLDDLVNISWEHEINLDLP